MKFKKLFLNSRQTLPCLSVYVSTYLTIINVFPRYDKLMKTQFCKF